MTEDQRSISEVRSVAIVLPCYNEEKNIAELHERLRNVAKQLCQYHFLFYFIDNASTDDTVGVIRKLAEKDSRVRGIVNARNFGHIRSPYHGLLQTEEDCAILMASDLQDPPELVADFLEQWEAGNQIVVGKKTTSSESKLFFLIRSVYYSIVRRISEIEMLEHVTGFGLYDRRVLEIFRSLEDPYPYTRGMITEIGLPYSVIPYHQPVRTRGITKNNFMTLFDMAMLATTAYSKLPLRLATIGGFILSAMSLLVALGFLTAKLLFWDSLPAGYAPAVIGIFFIGSIQIFLLGITGEYVGAVLTHVKKRPLVVEKYRLGNWD